jgi:hypothetical protein
VATRRHDRRAKPALADGPVQRLLADAQKASRRARADELVISVTSCCASPQPQRLGVLGQEAAMASRGDQRRPELSPRDGAKNCRSADTKAIG